MIDIEEIKGFAYRMLEDRLMEIPSVGVLAVRERVSKMVYTASMIMKHSKKQGSRCSICPLKKRQSRSGTSGARKKERASNGRFNQQTGGD